MRGKVKLLWAFMIPLTIVAFSVPAGGADRCVLTELFGTTT